MPGMLMLGPCRLGGCVLGTWGSEKELVVAGLAIHLVIALAEGALVQLAPAVAADEVLGVVPAPCGRDAAPGDGAAAAMADGALPLMEVQLAVGPSLQLEEGAATEASQALLGEGEGKAGMVLGARPLCACHACHPAHRAHEALAVPDTLQGRQVVVHDRALTALAFGGKQGQEVLVAVWLPIALQEPCGEGTGVGTHLGMAHAGDRGTWWYPGLEVRERP